MVVGIILGCGIGLVGGVVAGQYAFASMKPKDFMQYDISREIKGEVYDNDKIPSDADSVYPYLPMWTKFPDYEKTEWINQIIKRLWPYLDLAITEQVLEQAKAQLQDIVNKTPVLDAVEIEHFELGEKPIRLGGIKSYESSDYECIFETMLMWGSSSKIRVGLRLVLGPVGVYIPVEINEIQLIARSRITIRPLVEILPCVGAVSVQLLENPFYDFGIHLINRLDILALPGVELLVNYLVGSVLRGMAVFPNAYSLDIMPNGGYPIPPAGMISVDVEQIDGIQGQFTVYLEVREGRQQKADYGVKDTFNNSSSNNLVVDKTNQTMKIYVKEFGVLKAKLVAEGILEFQNEDDTEKDFIKAFGVKKDVTIDLLEPGSLNVLKGIGKLAKGVGSVGMGLGRGVGKVATAPVNLVKKKKEKEQELEKEAIKSQTAKAKKSGKIKGQMKLGVTWQPFQQQAESDEDEDDDEAAKKKKVPKNMKTFFSRQSTSGISDDLKGILTVTLRRAKNLVNEQGSCDPYVNFELIDQSRPLGGQVERQQSTLVLNDPDARWGEKFEFVNISATSMLNISVQDKVGLQEALLSGSVGNLIPFHKKNQDPIIGKLRMPVSDIVRNGQIRDNFPLQEVEQGELSLVFEWQKITQKT